MKVEGDYSSSVGLRQGLFHSPPVNRTVDNFTDRTQRRKGRSGPRRLVTDTELPPFLSKDPFGCKDLLVLGRDGPGPSEGRGGELGFGDAEFKTNRKISSVRDWWTTDEGSSLPKVCVC